LKTQYLPTFYEFISATLTSIKNKYIESVEVKKSLPAGRNKVRAEKCIQYFGWTIWREETTWNT